MNAFKKNTNKLNQLLQLIDKYYQGLQIPLLIRKNNEQAITSGRKPITNLKKIKRLYGQESLHMKVPNTNELYHQVIEQNGQNSAYVIRMTIMGQAGTGKSILIHMIRKIFQSNSVIVAAPTGMAGHYFVGQAIRQQFKVKIKDCLDIGVMGDNKEVMIHELAAIVWPYYLMREE